jgi:hypothetical protein
MKNVYRFNPVNLFIVTLASVVTIELPVYSLMKSFDIGFIQNTSVGDSDYICGFTTPNQFTKEKKKFIFYARSKNNVDFAIVNLNGTDVVANINGAGVNLNSAGEKINQTEEYKNSNTLIKITYKKKGVYSPGAAAYNAKLTITHNGNSKTLNLRGFCGT